MSAFCEPDTTTSMSHSSWGSDTAPSADTASTTISASWSCATCASAWMSFSTPVEVSENVVKTTRASGVSPSTRSRSPGSTLLPQPAS